MKTSVLKFIFWIILVSFSFSTEAEIIKLSNHTSYFLDSNSLTFNQAQHSINQFTKIEDDNINFAYQETAVWFHSKIVITDPDISIFHIENSYAEYLDAYFIIGNKIVEKHTGNKRKFETRGKLKPIDYAFQLELNKGDTLEIFCRVVTHSPMIYPAYLKSEAEYTNYEQNAGILYGIFFGVLLIMFFYNGIIAFTLKDASYWYYTLMVLASILVFAGESGVLYKYVCPTWYWLSPLEKKFTIPFLIVTTSLFFVSFLEVKEYSKKIYYVTIGHIIIGTIIIIYSCFFEVYGVGSKGITIHAPLLLVYAIIIHFRGNKDAMSYIVAWALYLIMGMSMTLRNLGILPSVFITEHGAEIGAILEVTFLSFALAQRIKRVRKEIREIEKKHLSLVLEKNADLDKKVAQRTKDLNNTLQIVNDQNIALKEKDKLVTSSISYAKKIQETFIPDMGKMKAEFKDVCLYYKPRDIVSGDFIYYKNINDKTYVVLADCTGHGVPGAFMSILGSNLLDTATQVLNIEGIVNILTFLNKEFTSRLGQHNDEILDGMEVAIVEIDKSKNTFSFSGAAQPIYFQTTDGQYHFVKGSVKPIGGNQVYYANKNYEAHVFDLNEISQFYLFSDGFADQFGGDCNKKFSKKRLISLLQDIEKLNGKERTNQLEKAFNAHKEDCHQTDDVTILNITL